MISNKIILGTGKGNSATGHDIVDAREPITTEGGYNVSAVKGKRIVWSTWREGETSSLHIDYRPCDLADATMIRIEHFSRGDDGKFLSIKSA